MTMRCRLRDSCSVERATVTVASGKRQLRFVKSSRGRRRYRLAGPYRTGGRVADRATGMLSMKLRLLLGAAFAPLALAGGAMAQDAGPLAGTTAVEDVIVNGEIVFRNRTTDQNPI